MKLSLTHIEERWSCELDLNLAADFSGSAAELATYLQSSQLDQDIIAMFGSQLPPPEYTQDEWEALLPNLSCETYVVGEVIEEDEETLRRFGTGCVAVEAGSDPDEVGFDEEFQTVVDTIKKALLDKILWHSSLATPETWKLEHVVMSEGYGTCLRDLLS